MAQRYVRIQTQAGHLHYGLLEVDRCVQVLDAPPWLGGQPANLVLPQTDYRLMAPCAPSKIVAVGKNYRKHAAEMKSQVPAEPLLFIKPSTTVTATQSPVFYPSQSQRVDYEGELAIVIGDRCTDCSPEAALGKIWGYTIANDVTARDLQRSDHQWTRAKGFDTFCPLGPWIVRELPAGARLETFVNDTSTPVQSASTEDMVFTPDVLIAYISQAMTLLPGDVVLTGTPEGVGPVQVGDRIQITIEGIGTLENTIAPRHRPTDKWQGNEVSEADADVEDLPEKTAKLQGT
ncbi:MAG: fumarylacetoacetate hydrolase family protein [Cyanothece sp. SIO2G6]|nr:fumarylacetoacetate hydrolase family protein [Cyanothece sp. SIO2G6]